MPEFNPEKEFNINVDSINKKRASENSGEKQNAVVMLSGVALDKNKAVESMVNSGLHSYGKVIRINSFSELIKNENELRSIRQSAAVRKLLDIVDAVPDRFTRTYFLNQALQDHYGDAWDDSSDPSVITEEEINRAYRKSLFDRYLAETRR